MKIALYSNGDRGQAVGEALIDAGHEVGHIIPYNLHDTLKEYDLAVVAGYSKIIPAEVLPLPKHGFINCHAGKLPEYRGGSPINWALLNGEKRVYATVLQMDGGIDTGDILRQCYVDVVDYDTVDTIHEGINARFPELILEIVEGLSAGSPITPRPQPEEGARYWPQRSAKDSEITLDMPPAQVYNKVRACREPYPAFIRLGKHSYKLELKT